MRCNGRASRRDRLKRTGRHRATCLRLLCGRSISRAQTCCIPDQVTVRCREVGRDGLAEPEFIACPNGKSWILRAGLSDELPEEVGGVSIYAEGLYLKDDLNDAVEDGECKAACPLAILHGKRDEKETN